VPQINVAVDAPVGILGQRRHARPVLDAEHHQWRSFGAGRLAKTLHLPQRMSTRVRHEHVPCIERAYFGFPRVQVPTSVVGSFLDADRVHVEREDGVQDLLSTTYVLAVDAAARRAIHTSVADNSHAAMSGGLQCDSCFTRCLPTRERCEPVSTS
jgi:hypothetical protein